jgi:hypothetical protein
VQDDLTCKKIKTLCRGFVENMRKIKKVSYGGNEMYYKIICNEEHRRESYGGGDKRVSY